MLALIALFQLAATQPAAEPAAQYHHGIQRQLEVPVPRQAPGVVVDGILDEPQWRRAAVLTGFSAFHPNDGQPADDSTEVLLWYSADAMHVGIRAFEAHGAVRATLADRDKLDGEDHVQVMFDTFRDRRTMYVFAVNALGVQADGVRSEGGGAAGGGSGGGMGIGSTTPFPGLRNTDLSPDFVFESKGRLTDSGFEVEMRIPFESIRYAAGDVQAWGIHVLRQVQHSGYQQSWVPATRASATFLGQQGTLTGLQGMQRGLVLDVNPVLTSTITGREQASGSWQYENTPELGGNVRWGITPNLTLNGTVNPDFSQVEADAAQVAGDPRFALFFAEKRPFFVDGIEQLDTPNRLIYTRRIVQPLAAAKVSGRVGRTDVAVIGALDDGRVLGQPDDPRFAIVRLKRDVGRSTVGLAYTDRVSGDAYNRVLSADARGVFARIWQYSLQAGGSVTGDGDGSEGAPIWEGQLQRTGRHFGFRYQVTGIGDAFRAASGFVPRADFARASLNHRLQYFGRRGATIETATLRPSLNALWPYAEAFDGTAPLETELRADLSATLRGGWSIGVTPGWERYDFDPRDYAAYAILTDSSGTPAARPFTPGAAVTFPVLSARISTPQFQRFAAEARVRIGDEVEFFETAEARRFDIGGSVEWRPTARARVDASYSHSYIARARDGSTFSVANIPRLKVEYQVSRPIFVRFVGQYDSRSRDALRDPQTDLPIARFNGTGYAVTTPVATNAMRLDWLFSYQPSPGTVLFAGYGSSLEEDDSFAFRRIERTADGFFVKLSYVWRL